MHCTARRHENRTYRRLCAQKAEWRLLESEKWISLAQGDRKAFRRAFKKGSHGQCPVSKAQQLAHFKKLAGFLEETGKVQVDTNINPGNESDHKLDYSSLTCLGGEFSLEELQECIQALKQDKACGVGGIMAEMVIDGGDALRQCLLNMCNRILEGVFPAGLSLGQQCSKQEMSMTWVITGA